MSGKNSADIRMVVDAIDLCYSKSHIDTFALLTGDSDFSPLVSKLKENDKRVIGCGVRNSTSDLLVDNCDEFIFYDDLVREAHAMPSITPLSFSLSLETSGEKSESPERITKVVMWPLEATRSIASTTMRMSAEFLPV